MIGMTRSGHVRVHERAPRPLRVALIGCGKMGQQHLRAIRSLAGVSIVGVADPAASKERLDGVLPRDTPVFNDPAVMLDELRPDVVHVVTPPHTHATLASAALRAGCHVYVEKPFTQTRAEAERLIALAAERGLQVCAGHQCLFDAAAQNALEQLPLIGRLVHVESFLSFRTVRRDVTPVEQTKDIMPHAVYPLVEQLRAGSGHLGPIEVCAVEARAQGDVYALLRLSECTGVLTISLTGRPVEQYQRLVGTNGSLHVDYVIGGVIRLAGPGAGLGVLFTPYRRAFQTLARATAGFSRLVLDPAGSYRGLRTLIDRFYASVRDGAPPAISARSMLDTVDICERIGHALDEVEREAEQVARAALASTERTLPAVGAGNRRVLVTGGTGFLGRRVAEELRRTGFAVRVVSRRMPPYVSRLAGVEYVTADLGCPLDSSVTRDISLIVHCAAETAGGKDAHDRNSIGATQHVLEAAGRAAITQVIHISSLAVLRRSSRPIDESAPIDPASMGRGPYVWGKAESEQRARELGAVLGVKVKVIRPGPLVDYRAFHAPGRLGREVGPFFAAIGPKRGALNVCDVSTAAEVVRSYAEDFGGAPDILNLVEAPPPTRGELARRLRETRPDLRFVWVPAFLVRALNGPAKLIQRFVLGKKDPVDVYAAFASETYRSDLAASVIGRARAAQLSVHGAMTYAPNE